MRDSNRLSSVLLPVLVAAMACSACTTIYGAPGRKMTESLLTTSGFKMSAADNPKELAALEAKPQRKVVALQRGGKTYYGYTDAKGCGCAYLGDEAAYKQYQTYLAEDRAIDEQKPEHVPMDAPVSVITVYDDDEWAAWGGDTF